MPCLVFYFYFLNYALNVWTFCSNAVKNCRMASGRLVWLLAWQSQEIPCREHSWWTFGCSCTHMQHTHTHPFSPLKLGIITHDPLPLYYTWTLAHPNTSGKGLLHDSATGCEWINLPHLHRPCPLISHRSPSSQHSAVLVLSSARDPNNIELFSAGTHKHTASIILCKTCHYVLHHNKIFVPASEWYQVWQVKKIDRVRPHVYDPNVYTDSDVFALDFVWAERAAPHCKYCKSYLNGALLLRSRIKPVIWVADH